jgi:quinol-cytochrome oxidoreductase complex cytochrome b subunit
MSEAHSQKEESIPFYPDHVRTEFYVTIGIMVLVFIVGILGLIKPVGLGEPADPLNTPLHVKPEWYFLALYQILKYIPPQVLGLEGKVFGAVIPVVLVGLIALLPFLDRKQDRSRKVYLTRGIIVAVLMIILIALTIWGEVS